MIILANSYKNVDNHLQNKKCSSKNSDNTPIAVIRIEADRHIHNRHYLLPKKSISVNLLRSLPKAID